MKNVAKTAKKEQLIIAYNQLFQSKVSHVNVLHCTWVVSVCVQDGLVCLCHVQRFKGSEPIEEVTEKVKAVKIEDKPKEAKAEVVDEVFVLESCM